MDWMKISSLEWRSLELIDSTGIQNPENSEGAVPQIGIKAIVKQKVQ